MKITDVVVTPVVVPSEQESTQTKMRKGASMEHAVIVQVFTDEGIVGIGETPCVVGIELSAAFVASAKPHLVGKDPSNITLLMKQLYVLYNLTHFHVSLGTWAFGGIELALWDIAAQRAGMPLYQLWGGAFRKKIPFQANIEPQELEGMTTQAAQYAAMGYKLLYTKVGFDPEADVEAVAAIRRGAPDPSIKIRVDFNQSYSGGVAVNVINRMEPYGLESAEQPVLMYNIDALRDVKNRVSVPILGHECGWNMHEMLNVIKANAADALKLDGRFDLGYAGVRITAGMAEAAGLPCTYHAYYQLGIATVGALHVIASCPAFTMPSSIGGYNKVLDDVLVGGPIRMEEVPYLTVPEEPGIGVKIDPDRLAKYHELYIKEIKEKNMERETENPYYTAMGMRAFFKEDL